MKSEPSPADTLWRALLDEAASADFRAATLAATLRGARRRRHLRLARATTAALALPLLAAALLLLPARLSTPRLATGPLTAPSAPAACEIVRTRPDPVLLVSTRPLVPGQLLASTPLEHSARVRTDWRLGPRLIDDAELLALAPPSSALVRLAPGHQRLVLPTAAHTP
jgi:hypothetical protein